MVLVGKEIMASKKAYNTIYLFIYLFEIQDHTE